MTKKTLLVATLLAVVPALLRADITFTFNEVGSDVVMTSSGTLDTSKLLAGSSSGWGGIGVETNGAEIDIMGSTVVGGIDQSFQFHVGTDISALVTPVGPFALSWFAGWVVTEGTKSFATYAGFEGGLRLPGISLLASDLVDGFWTPDQKWTNANATLASLGLNVGVYSVVDSETSETITIRINEGTTGSVPRVPDGGATIALWGVALAGLAALRRRREG